jgi:hypothetical protein
MSIPLDRLYHYLENISQEISENNVLIYRFLPHGSKKLTDLDILHNEKLEWVKKMTQLAMIYHDQEPLEYSLYSEQELWTNFNQRPWPAMYTEEQMPGLKDFITSMHLRGQIWVPFNCYDNVLLCHSEQNSSNLDLYESNGFIGVYWWSHAAIAKDWFRYAEHDLKLIPELTNIKKDFLVYNRAWTGTREYRLLFAELIANGNLISSCNMKFSPLDNEQHYRNHVFKNKNLSITRHDLEELYPPNCSTSSASADYDTNDYTTSGIEIVLETLFDDARYHLTEKSLRPIACGRPFILVATPGSLTYLQKYGFETFSGLIDESYDSIQDPVQRLHAVTHEMQRISRMDPQSKLSLWQQLYEISARNQQRFFSTQWQNSIVAEYVSNFKTALRQAEKQVTGRYWKKISELGKNNTDFVDYINTNNAHRTLEEHNRVLQWLEQRNQ